MEEICCFCNQLINNNSVISLKKVLRDDDVMEAFKKRIPEFVSTYSFLYYKILIELLYCM